MRSVAIAIVVVAGCGGAVNSERPKPPVDATPHIFATGAVSTAAPEFSIALSADGKTAYFDRAAPDRSTFTIMASTFANGAWQPATALPFSTGAFRDVDPFVAGARLYFSSNRRHPADGATDFDYWYVERVGAGWTEPVPAGGALGGPGNQFSLSIARDGTAYFQSDVMPGVALYRAARAADGSYTTAVSIDAAIGAGSGASNPAISPDGTLLVFAAEHDDGVGGSDLYVSRLAGYAWSPAQDLGAAINSASADFAPAFSPDGRSLFFTSERPGIVPAQAAGRPPGDIYQFDVAALSPR